LKDNILQLALMACSCSAVLLVTSKNPRTRAWGCFVGFCGQPLWFATAYRHWQWGIMTMCFWYGGCYIRGFFGARAQLREPIKE
jgi:hypothetical protein